MKFLPPPILAVLASGLCGCALAPPSHSNGGTGDSSSSSSASSSPKGGNSGGGGTSSSSRSSVASSGGTKDPGSAMGSSIEMGGSSSSRGGSSANSSGGVGGTSTGASSASGGTASGGRVNTGGASLGGTTNRGGSSGGSSAGASSSSSKSTYPQPPRITSGGSNGWTTRYWDCCKASCGWAANANGKPCTSCGKDGVSTADKNMQSACNGGQSFMCYWGAPWAVSDTLAFGYAAHNGVPCGTCFQLDFTGKGHYGNNPGSQSLANKTMIVQVINIGGIESAQFDLLIPGGGVGANNACTAGPSQWGNVDIGATNGGILTSCKDKACVTQKCQAAFNGKPQLIEGCKWFTDWFNIADNPEMVFKQITCPAEITSRSGM